MTELKEITIDEIINQNNQFLILLGYSLSLLNHAERNLKLYCEDDEKFNEQHKWYKEAINNIVYLKKAPPPCP